MKLDKVTEYRPRWYDDGCGTALALELVGERWALLIVRELMYGPCRFGEIRRALPGLSANVLTQRLARLSEVGLLRRRMLPPPASVQVFELTPWARESEPAIQALGRWAVRSPLHDPTLPLSGAALMMSFRTMLAPDRAAGIEAAIGMRLGADLFRTRLNAGALEVVRGEPANSDLLFAAGSTAPLAAAVYCGVPLAALEGDGALRVEGDRALALRFTTLFPLPAKVAAV